MIVFYHPEAQAPPCFQPGAPAYTTGTVLPAILGHRPALPLGRARRRAHVQGLASGPGAPRTWTRPRPPRPPSGAARFAGDGARPAHPVDPGPGRRRRWAPDAGSDGGQRRRSRGRPHAALAPSGASATGQGLERAYAVAAGYNLNRAALQVRVYSDGFARGATVSAVVTYDVVLNDIPFLRWTNLRLTDSHAERVDLYRSYR